jgi:hypothetical protein
VKLTVGQVWCVAGEDNRAYFLITRYSEENRAWMALCLYLGVGWLPWKDGDEMLFHIDKEVTASHLELVCG